MAGRTGARASRSLLISRANSPSSLWCFTRSALRFARGLAVPSTRGYSSLHSRLAALAVPEQRAPWLRPKRVDLSYGMSIVPEEMTLLHSVRSKAVHSERRGVLRGTTRRRRECVRKRERFKSWAELIMASRLSHISSTRWQRRIHTRLIRSRTQLPGTR